MGYNKKSLLLGVLIGFLFTGIIFLCFILFFNNRLDKNEISNVYKYSLDNKQNVQMNAYYATKYSNSFFITVDLSGNAYLNVYGESDAIVKIIEKYQRYSFVGKNSTKSDFIHAYKLDVANVLFVQNTEICSGDNCSFGIFVLENGELAYLNYDLLSLTGNVKIKKIDGFKDIISIMPDGWVVDINGNEYKLPDDLY